MCEICKCRVATSLYLEGRGEGVSVEEGETPLDPPLESVYFPALVMATARQLLLLQSGRAVRLILHNLKSFLPRAAHAQRGVK